MSEELSAALKNAIERGSSLAGAKQSLLNAGYTRSEIEQAASSMDSSGSYLTNLSKEKPMKIEPLQNLPELGDIERIKPKPKPKSKAKIILLIILIIVILGIIGFLLFYWKTFINSILEAIT